MFVLCRKREAGKTFILKDARTRPVRGTPRTENSSSVSVQHTNITKLVFMHVTEK